MISIVCLVICLMTFICFKNIQSDRLTIHKNLCLSLLVAEVLFMAGISQTKRQLMCTIFAVFLHYSFLAVFSWMGLEGIQLYFMLITVFKTGHSRRKYFYLLGYGVPAVIVLTSVIIDHFLYGFRGYGTEWYCWLNTKWGFIWAFVGPICFVILVNIIFLVMTFVVMCRHPTSPTHREDSKMANLRVWLKASCALLCLLGVTWVFGMMYVDSSTMVMAYIFTILNSLQGIFIFIFHCLMDEKIIKEYKRCFQQGRCCPCCDQYSLVNSSNQLATKSTISTKKAGLYNTSTANEKRLSVSSTGKNILDPSVRYTPANQEDQKGTNSTDDINDASSSDKVKFSNLQDKLDINDDDGGDTVQHDNTPDQRRSDFEPSTHKNKSDSQLSHPGQQKERRKNDKIFTWSMPDLVPKSDTFVVLTSVRKGCSDSNINQPSTLLKKRLEAETSI
ncbi:adhesion G protein-coupled receptor L3-like [Glandiceps talaboti]